MLPEAMAGRRGPRALRMRVRGCGRGVVGSNVPTRKVHLSACSDACSPLLRRDSRPPGSESGERVRECGRFVLSL